jgi:hypothetical protein
MMSHGVTINVHEVSFQVLYRHFHGGTEEEALSKPIDWPIFESAFFLVVMSTAIHPSTTYGISILFCMAL